MPAKRKHIRVVTDTAAFDGLTNDDLAYNLMALLAECQERCKHYLQVATADKEAARDGLVLVSNVSTILNGANVKHPAGLMWLKEELEEIAAGWV